MHTFLKFSLHFVIMAYWVSTDEGEKNNFNDFSITATKQNVKKFKELEYFLNALYFHYSSINLASKFNCSSIAFSSLFQLFICHF